jgi:lipopolysaccharide export system permease protein
MVVLFSTGMSQTRLFLITLGVAALISVLTAWLSFFAGPWGLAHLQQVLQQQKNRAEFSMLSPGSFYTDRTSNLVIYAESAGSDNKELHDIYTFKLPSSRADPRDNMWVMSAQSAKQNWRQGVRYIELKDGYRYEGLPGQLNYRVTQFGTYAFKLAEPQLPVTVTKAEGLTTKALLAQPSPANNAEWQWRLSMPILPLMMALIAVPLSRTQPRQGRFTKLLPAMLIYVLYLAGLSSAEKALAAGDLPAWLGLWWLHLIFLLLLAAFYLTKWVRQHRYNKQLQLREGHETA